MLELLSNHVGAPAWGARVSQWAVPVAPRCLDPMVPIGESLELAPAVLSPALYQAYYRSHWLGSSLYWEYQLEAYVLARLAWHEPRRRPPLWELAPSLGAGSKQGELMNEMW